MSRGIVLQRRIRRNRKRHGLGEDELCEIGWVDQRFVREEGFRLWFQKVVVLYVVNVESGFYARDILTRHSPA